MNSTYAKLMKISFIILIFIVLAEIGYYIYTNYIKKVRFQEQAVGNVILTKDILPSIVPTEAIFRPQDPSQVARSLVGQGVLISVNRVEKYKSEIIGIEKKEGMVGNFRYVLKLTIRVGDSDKKDFYFNEHDLAIMKIYKLINNKEVPANLDDLKISDVIIIEIHVNELKENNIALEGIKITKI